MGIHKGGDTDCQVCEALDLPVAEIEIGGDDEWITVDDLGGRPLCHLQLVKGGKMIVTIEHLEQAQACREAIETFRVLFWGPVEVTEENLKKAQEAGLDLNWWIQHCVPEILEAYLAQRQPLFEAYLAQRRPLLEAYEAQIQPLWAAYEAEVRRLILTLLQGG